MLLFSPFTMQTTSYRATMEALQGKKAIFHIYNSTSVLQRDVVFNKSKEEIKQIAIDGTKLVKNM